MKTLFLVTAAIALVSVSGIAQATVTVSSFGDQGWYADDTRTAAGTDLVGTSYTHAGKPTQAATPTDDALIANQIQFVANAPGNVGALKLSFGAAPGGAGKATLSTINTGTGFATGNWSTGFFANMRRYRDTETNTTLKIGVQSTSWAASQSGYTASRTGESEWDVSLTYVGNYTPFHIWEDVSLSSTDSLDTWRLSLQTNNAYFKTLDGGFTTANKTLANWALDPVWGSRLFSGGAKVTSVLLGAGSFSNLASNGYVDYLETNLVNDGERTDFGAPAVPEPMSIMLGLMGLGSIAGYRKLRK